MVAWWSQLSGADKFFVICATIGGVFFLFRLILQFSGVFGDMDADTEVDADVDVDVDADVGDHVDAATADAGDIGAADFSFQLFTFQGLTGFFLMFGLVGYTAHRQLEAGLGWALVAAMVAGLLMVLVISWMFTFFKRMQHSGTLKLANAVGREGKVYMNIPEDEPGKVQVDVQGRLAILDAVSEDKSNIPTDTRVKVVKVISGNVLVVRKV
jgi:membrane protein implicated in regulation of membrane protease activity